MAKESKMAVNPVLRAVLAVFVVSITAISSPAMAQLKILESGDVEIGQTPTKSNLSVTGTISGYGTVPIGAVVDWWRPASSSLQPPDNFVICDGHTINDPDSPFNGQRVPSLQGLFVEGVTATSSIGTKGGSAQANVSMTVQLPDSTGAIPTSAPPWNADGNAGLIVRGKPKRGYRFGLIHRASVATVPPYYGLLKIIRIK